MTFTTPSGDGTFLHISLTPSKKKKKKKFLGFQFYNIIHNFYKNQKNFFFFKSIILYFFFRNFFHDSKFFELNNMRRCFLHKLTTLVCANAAVIVRSRTKYVVTCGMHDVFTIQTCCIILYNFENFFFQHENFFFFSKCVPTEIQAILTCSLNIFMLPKTKSSKIQNCQESIQSLVLHVSTMFSWNKHVFTHSCSSTTTTQIRRSLREIQRKSISACNVEDQHILNSALICKKRCKTRWKPDCGLTTQSGFLAKFYIIILLFFHRTCRNTIFGHFWQFQQCKLHGLQSAQIGHLDRQESQNLPCLTGICRVDIK